MTSGKHFHEMDDVVLAIWVIVHSADRQRYVHETWGGAMINYR